MRVLILSLLLAVSPAFAAGSPLMDDLRPVATNLDHHREIDWFQGQTVAVQQRWARSIEALPSPARKAAEGGRARVDMQIDGAGKVIGASVGRSTGNLEVDQELIESIEDTRLTPPPKSLPDDAGFVHFSIYFDITAQTESVDESSDAA